MIAGDPFGKDQRHLTAFGRNVQLRVIDVARSVG